jgi:NCAIR mutase (PurE)-related protein
MRPEQVKELLESVSAGRLSPDDALCELRAVPVADLGFARIDLHRELRQGLPEAIYAEHKRPEEVVAIAARMLDEPGSPVLATRVTPEIAAALTTAFPRATHHERARLVVLRSAEIRLGTVAVVAAGTSDLPVAEEAAFTAAALGAEADLVVDVGVAGLHRLLEQRARLDAAEVVIVVAGMEGALASLVGGIVAAPVIAVPTSVGYGASFEGLAALLGMLSSCAAGITVTNIDNGFGAAVAAAKILRAARGRLG